MIDPEIEIMMGKAREEVRQFAIRRHKMMMNKEEMDKMMESMKGQMGKNMPQKMDMQKMMKDMNNETMMMNKEHIKGGK